MLKRIKQIIQGDGRSVSRLSAAGTPGWARMVAETKQGEASVDFTLTTAGQLWVNTRGAHGFGSAVTLVATLDPATGTWAVEHEHAEAQ
jgi:hypothetical protein